MWISVSTAATELGLSRQMVYHLMSSGDLKWTYQAGRKAIHPTTLAAYIKKRERTGKKKAVTSSVAEAI